MKAKLELKGMEFHAYHGCWEEEKLYGNRFLVDFCGSYDISKACESDNLADAQDVVAIHRVIDREMRQASSLIEHAASRIYRALRTEFPAFESISIRLSKCNPSLEGAAELSSITIEHD